MIFALILWFNDRPITGSVIKLINVKRPRKEPEQYTVGEKVTAVCQGFGTHEGIIAQIEEDGKQRLTEVLKNSTEFQELVRKFGSVAIPTLETTEERDTNKDKELPQESTRQSKKEATKKKAKQNKQSVAERQDLEKAAQSLELTELSAFMPVAAATTTFPSTSSESSSLIAQSLNILNPSPVMPVAVFPDDSRNWEQLQARVEYLEQTIQRQEQTILRQEGLLGRMDQTLQWLLNAYHGYQQFTQQSPNVQQPVQSQAVVPTEQVATGAGNPTETTYNGYTKDQLKSKITGLKDFSKSSKLLFRMLYREEEFAGKSLTGSKANKNFAQRPALGHPERMEALYDIIQEQFPSVTPAMIRERLRDIVKPSRNN